MTYVAELFLAFSDADKAQSARRRVVNFAELAQSILHLQSDYERRAAGLLAEVYATLSDWESDPPATEYAQVVQQRDTFIQTYRSGRRRRWAAERDALQHILADVGVKAQSHGLKAYAPPSNLGTVVRQGSRRFIVLNA
jgi:hypothetical protein